jgi:hypothetical protein
MSFLSWQEVWEGKQDFYTHLSESNRLKEADKMPDIGHDVFYIKCFYELSTERNNGMGMGPIPISKIWDYQARFKLDFDFCDIILQLDNQYLLKELKKDGGKSSPNSRTPSKR